MTALSDRNLLFGILAVQMDFISGDQLVAGMNAWMIAKEKPLEEILLAQGALQSDARSLLDSLVEKHVELHGGRVEKSLLALSSSGIGSLCPTLTHIPDSDIASSLAVLNAIRGEHTAGGHTAAADQRFRILRSHAKGGMGEVFVAVDEQLNREVALKEMQSRFANAADNRVRFSMEAEITGNLEHPGIVPVYGLGEYSDGRPFYAMRFIRGGSLQEAIERFHATFVESRFGGGEPLLELRNLLRRFVDVCNAIEYAHSRGVLHRDLKPGNVVLGKYGETLVVDWGLAKALGDSERADPHQDPLKPLSDSGSAPTRMGAAIGTPAYMSPEQATGRVGELGPATDVYGLGATLYHILTGRPPFFGTETGILRRVNSSEFASPRSIDHAIPKPLEAICLKAMALAPADRYASSRDVANDVERFLADEPVGAHRDTPVERSRRWIRKNPALTATSAVAFLMIVIGLGAFSTVVSGKNAELSNLNRMLDSRNSELTVANQRALEARTLAETNEKAARTQSQLAMSTLTSVIRDIQDGLRELPGSGEVRRRLLATSLRRLDQVATKYVEQANVDHDTIAALHEMGDVVMQFGIAGMSGGESSDQQSTLTVARSYFTRAHEVATRLMVTDRDQARAKRDLSITLAKLGDLSWKTGQVQEAIEYYRQTLDLSRSLASAAPTDKQAQRDLSVSLSKLADARLQRGETDEPFQLYQEALEIRRGLAARDTTNAQAQRDASTTLDKLGQVHLHQGLLPEAIRMFQQALDIREKLVAASPSDSAAQHSLSLSYDNVGDANLLSGDVAKALAYFEKSLEIRRALADADPANSHLRRDLSVAMERMGDASMQVGQLEDARDYFRQSRELRVNLAESDPTNAQAQRDLMVSLNKSGEAELESGRVEEARRFYADAFERARTLEALEPTDAQAQSDLAACYFKLGTVSQHQRAFEEAAQLYENAIGILKRLDREGRLPESQRDWISEFQQANDSCRLALLATGDWSIIEGLPPEQRLVACYHRVGQFARQGRWPEADDAIEKWLAMKPATTEHLYDLACGYGVYVGEYGKSHPNPTPEQTVILKQRTMSALDTLSQAIAAGFADASLMSRDSDLAVFRELPEFTQLLRRIAGE